MLIRSLAIACTLFVSVPVSAQIYIEADPAMGQPTLRGARPVWFNAIAIPLDEGNPDFAMCTQAPDPVPMGSPTWLAFYFSKGSLSEMQNKFNFCFDERPVLPPLGNFNQVVLVFGGFTDATGHGEPVPIPLAPLPTGLSVRVNTLGVTLDGSQCVFASDGITLKT